MLHTVHTYAQSTYPNSISEGAYNNINNNTWHNGLRQLQYMQFETKPTEFSARNNSRPLAIFRVLSDLMYFDQPNVSYFLMGQ